VNTTIVELFRQVEISIAADRGSLALFALLLRPEAAGVASTSATAPYITERWDVLVSASWLEEGSKESIDYIVKKIRKKVNAEQLREISRVAVVSHTSDMVMAFNRAVDIEHGAMQFTGSTLFGFYVEQAYVITSKNATRLPTSQSLGTGNTGAKV